jgi:exosortase
LLIRSTQFALLVFSAVLLSWRPLLALYTAAFQVDQYSHILLILPVSVAIMYLERQRVFRKVQYCLPAGVILVLLLGALAWVAWHPLPLSQNDALAVRVLLFVLWSVAAFVLCYGTLASRSSTFPLLFLFLMVPVPDFILDGTIWLLQRGSTDVTFLLMKATNVPVLRNEVILSLPGIDIEVAKECSGIRSSLMLFIVSLVLGRLFLVAGWNKLALCFSVLPITLAKNGLRIYTLSTLGIYVDPSFLTGSLHHYGGIPFFALAMAMLVLVAWLLHKHENKTVSGDLRVPATELTL